MNIFNVLKSVYTFKVPPASHRCHFRKLSDPFWKEKNVYHCNVCGSYYGKGLDGWKMIDRRDNANRP